MHDEDLVLLLSDFIAKASHIEIPVLRESIEKCISTLPADITSSSLQNVFTCLVKVYEDKLKSHSEQSLKTSDECAHQNLNDECHANDSDHIQIIASKAEIDRRIEAYMKNQRYNMDQLNIKEFCHKNPDDKRNCARVDAVYKPHHGKHHIKMRQALNTRGPQTKKVKDQEILPSEGINERLNNMELYTNIKTNSNQTFPQDVYSRLKDLEERIMFLEGLSPEYFQFYKYHNNDDCESVN